MYNSVLLTERMAELGLNFYHLAKEAGIDPKTAKKVVTEGKGHPDSIKAVAKVLKFTLPEIVKRAQLPMLEEADNGKPKSTKREKKELVRK